MRFTSVIHFTSCEVQKRKEKINMKEFIIALIVILAIGGGIYAAMSFEKNLRRYCRRCLYIF